MTPEEIQALQEKAQRAEELEAKTKELEDSRALELEELEKYRAKELEANEDAGADQYMRNR
jgi:hypothetical protein